MSILEIRKYPDESLIQRALLVTHPDPKEDSNLQKLIEDMIETIHNAGGIGLAAPQVGVLKRIIVIDLSSQEQKQPLLILLNPQIIKTEGIVNSEEGCLSLPHSTATIKRAEKVIVTGLNRVGNLVTVEADGLLSRALQHETDHLDGLLLFNRLGVIKRKFFKKKYLKSLKKSQQR